MNKNAPLLTLSIFLLLAIPLYIYRPGPAERKVVRYDRIVSIVPSVTELLFAVGAGNQVVGVTNYCIYPPEAKEKEKIGDLVVNYEKIIALNPDVVMSSDRLVRKTNEELTKMGLTVVKTEANSFEEIAEQLRQLGRLTGHESKGEEVARKMMERVRAVEEQVKGKPQPTVFFETTFDPILTAGEDTYTGDAIRRAGGKNIMNDIDRPWAQVSWEVILKRDPDVILIAHEMKDRLKSRAGWSDLKAVKTGRVALVPKEEFVLPTPRLVKGLERAAKLFHEACKE